YFHRDCFLRHLHSFPTRRSSDLRLCAEQVQLLHAPCCCCVFVVLLVLISLNMAKGKSKKLNEQKKLVEEDIIEYLDERHIEKVRSEEHTSELQSREKLVCRLLLE